MAAVAAATAAADAAEMTGPPGVPAEFPAADDGPAGDMPLNMAAAAAA